MKYPERIEAAQLRIYDIKERLRDKRAAIRSIEINISVDVCNAKDDRGKPLLSNETFRTAAIAKNLEDDGEYRKQVTEIRELERELATEEAGLERLRMEFRLECLEAEHRNNLAAMKTADAIWHAKHDAAPAYTNGVDQDIELPF